MIDIRSYVRLMHVTFIVIGYVDVLNNIFSGLSVQI